MAPAARVSVPPLRRVSSSPAAESLVLESIYREVQAAGEQQARLGEYVLGLGYGCLGLAVGFDCGDAVLFGRLASAGWLD